MPEQRSPEGDPVCGPAREAWYSTTQAVQRGLSDAAWAVYQLGDDVQRGVVDLLFDAVDGSAQDVLARTSRWTGLAQDAASAVDNQDGVQLVWQQARNNFDVYSLVKSVRSRLRFEPEGEVDVVALVGAAYALGPYADLWAIEGLGHDYTDVRLDRDGATQGILRDGAASALPPGSLTMMHAGLGLALAERMLRQVTPCSSDRHLRQVLERYFAACDAHGREGYRGAAYESLGLVARTWHSQVVERIDAVLLQIDERLSGYFWHGAGRALYFLPAYIVPLLSPWRAADNEAPHALAHDNLYAGLAWASTLVNIRQPEIVAGIARTQLRRSPDSRAFSNGVASAMVVRIDLTPGDPPALAFAAYQPPGTARVAWSALVAPAANAALTRYHAVLRAHQALEAVFRYTELDALVVGLERDAPPASPPARPVVHPGAVPRSPERRPGLYPGSRP